MFKQWFRVKVESTNSEGAYRIESSGPAMAPERAEALPRRFWDKGDEVPRSNDGGPTLESPGTHGPGDTVANGAFASFEEIYRNTPIRPAKVAYSITKVGDMINSVHLSGMSSETKRSSVLMALEAIGVRVEDLLQDAMMRLRALNEYQEAQNRQLKDFEAAKNQENAMIKAELDRISAAHMLRVQANLEQVARKEDDLRRWTLLKQQEWEEIASTAAFCAPHGNSSASGVGGLTAAVARLGAEAAVGKR